MSAKKGEKNPVRLPHGEARVQFIANLEEIEKLLSEGYGLAHIHRTLLETRKISMSKTAFQNLCRPDIAQERKERKKSKK